MTETQTLTILTFIVRRMNGRKYWGEWMPRTCWKKCLAYLPLWKEAKEESTIKKGEDALFWTSVLITTGILIKFKIRWMLTTGW
jgi:hypothetical protein